MPTATAEKTALARLYIPSAKPEIIPVLRDQFTKPDAVMAWNVYVHKPQGRPAYATGIEGAKSAQSFQTIFPGSATVGPIPITGPATLAKKKAALRGIVHQLAMRNAITTEAAQAALAKIDAAEAIDA